MIKRHPQAADVSVRSIISCMPPLLSVINPPMPWHIQPTTYTILYMPMVNHTQQKSEATHAPG